jgi:hypothetical protein
MVNSIYEAEAHVWIFEARTLSTQPVRRRCGMCGLPDGTKVPRTRPMGPDQEKPSGLPACRAWVALVLEADQPL